MKIKNAANCLAILGHSTRLSIYRLLVQAGHRGLTVVEIGRQLGISPTTLNHHFRVAYSFKIVCKQIELFLVTVLHVDRLPFKIRTISL
jgi:DNA-binding transcriptional ArsR family regulator